MIVDSVVAQKHAILQLKYVLMVSANPNASMITIVKPVRHVVTELAKIIVVQVRSHHVIQSVKNLSVMVQPGNVNLLMVVVLLMMIVLRLVRSVRIMFVNLSMVVVRTIVSVQNAIHVDRLHMIGTKVVCVNL